MRVAAARRHASGRLRALRRRRGAVILLYHRVGEVESDPQSMTVRPRRFADHLALLRERMAPLPLRELTARRREGTMPPRAVSVTFDDGYADNLSHARPLLERYGIPATVFVSTGQVGSASEFWWDELERLLLSPGRLPATLELAIDGSRPRFELGAAAEYGEDEYRKLRGWSVLERRAPGPRQRLYRSLCRLLRPLRAAVRENALGELRAWAGASAAARATHRALAPDELRRLADGELVEAGAHTVTHPVLSGLGPSEQLQEIERSRAWLEELLRRRVESFSYPYGSWSDYTPESVAAVQRAGFAWACASVSGAVRPETDPFELPRLVVRDWDGDELERRLAEWCA